MWAMVLKRRHIVKCFSQDKDCGYTVVELMITVVVVSVLAAVIGMFFVNLLTIQEREREEAYIRGRLADICAAYADYASIGSSFHISKTNLMTEIEYRLETGGVSLETGRVSRVAHLTTQVNKFLRNMDSSVSSMKLNIYSNEPEGLVEKISNNISGDAQLMPLHGDIVSCTIQPLNYKTSNVDSNGCETTDAALGLLRITAVYKFKNENGNDVFTNATAERVVRLWNRE